MTARSLLAICLGAGLVSSPALAAAPSPCARVSAELRRLDAAHVVLQRLVMPGLAKRSSPILVIDDRDQGVSLTQLGAAGAPADVVRALAEDGNKDLALREAGPVRMIQSVAGSAACSTFHFYTTTGGRGHTIPPPPDVAAVEHEPGMDFCWNDYGWLGRMSGAPAFIRETADETVDESDVSISLWNAGRWSPACHMTAHYHSTFEIAEARCRLGAQCAALRSQAVAFAARIDRMPKARLSPPGTHTARVRRMIALARAEKSPTLPVLGAAYKSPWSDFSSIDSALFPITLGGRVYMARLGHGVIGWRTTADYNLALYDLKGDRLEGVAGFVINKVRARLSRAG